MSALPRLYSSSDDLAFEDEDDLADTQPRIDLAASGIRAFFDSVVRELEETHAQGKKDR